GGGVGNEVRLEGRDNGGGVDARALPIVCVPFITTKPVGAGWGLGLAGSYASIHALGGQRTARNHADGAEFWFSLPNDFLEA
ncbi:sensor histidine kinase, partial [Pseudomonas syringae]